MITTEKKPLGDIIHLQQNIFQMNALRVKNELVGIVNSSNCDCLWLDMSQVKFIDSIGLGIIVTTYILVKRQDRSLVLCDVNDCVRLVFELTGLDQVLQFCSTTPDFSPSDLVNHWA